MGDFVDIANSEEPMGETTPTAQESRGEMTEKNDAVVEADSGVLISLKDFGAVGDGVTDDTAAWNMWKDTPGIHVITPGSYLVNGEVNRFDEGVIGNGDFQDADSAWDQPQGDRERHAIIVHRSEQNPAAAPVSPVIKTQTHITTEENNPPAASFKHVVGAYHEATLDGFYNIQSDTNQNYTVHGDTVRNRMAGLFGSLANLAYVEDATETENPLISTMGATKNGCTFQRFTRKALHVNGGYMFGHEIYCQNTALETASVPYQNSDFYSFGGAWTTGMKIGAGARSAPISSAIFTHGLSSRHGFWNGIVIGGSGFRINNNSQGVAGTVGLNFASWRGASGYGDIGIKFRTANRHLHFVEGAKVRASLIRVMNEAGAAGVSIEAAGGSNPYLHFRTGASGAADGGNTSTLGQIDANSSWTRLRSNTGEVHLDAGGTAIYAATSARFAPGTASDGLRHLGGANRRWNTVYATSGAISTSDERVKQDITSIPDEALDAWGDVEYSQFRMRDAVQAKGGDARLHTGVIAQRVVDVFASHGLDAAEYGLLCFDEWEATEEVVHEYTVTIKEAVYERVLTKEAEYRAIINEDGKEETIESIPAEYEDGNLLEPAVKEKHRDITPGREAGSLYGIRYEEALAFEAAFQRRRAVRVEERLSRLEALILAD